MVIMLTNWLSSKRKTKAFGGKDWCIQISRLIDFDKTQKYFWWKKHWNSHYCPALRQNRFCDFMFHIFTWQNIYSLRCFYYKFLLPFHLFFGNKTKQHLLLCCWWGCRKVREIIFIPFTECRAVAVY